MNASSELHFFFSKWEKINILHHVKFKEKIYMVIWILQKPDGIPNLFRILRNKLNNLGKGNFRNLKKVSIKIQNKQIIKKN